MERETVTTVFIKGTTIRPEKYVRLVQDMYEDSKIVVSCAVGQMSSKRDWDHQRSALVWRLIDEVSLCGL